MYICILDENIADSLQQISSSLVEDKDIFIIQDGINI